MQPFPVSICILMPQSVRTNSFYCAAGAAASQLVIKCMSLPFGTHRRAGNCKTGAHIRRTARTQTERGSFCVSWRAGAIRAGEGADHMAFFL